MKNIIIIVTDTFRFDNLRERAVLPVRTPHLDRFAATRATEMLNAYAGSFPTIPHRTDVITSRTGWPHYGWQSLQASGADAWPRLLAARGYRTQLICDCPHLFNSGFQNVFEAAFQHRGQECDLPLLRLNEPIRSTMPADKTRCGCFLGAMRPVADMHRWTNRYFTCREQTFALRTARTCVRWLEENFEAGPLFLWVDFFDPHEPWDPPEYLVRRYLSDGNGRPMIHPNYGRSSAYTPEELQNLRAHYAAESELVDRALGEVLQAVDDLRMWDDSVLAVTSDHGISIGEHLRVGKSNLSDDDPRDWPLYPEISHIPLLIAGCGVPAGAACDALVQPVDLLPTLCELAGVDAEPSRPVDGRSFVRAMAGDAAPHRTLAVTARHQPPAGSGPVPAGRETPFITDGRWGYVPLEADGAEGLYDLAEDPLAGCNMAGDAPQQCRRMREGFLHFLDRQAQDPPAVCGWRERMGG